MNDHHPMKDHSMTIPVIPQRITPNTDGGNGLGTRLEFSAILAEEWPGNWARVQCSLIE